MRALSKWTGRIESHWRRMLLVLFLVIVTGPTRAVGTAEEIAVPEWTVGDWWETGQYRVTVSSRQKDVYEVIRTPKGTEAQLDAMRQYKLRMTINGQVIARIEPNGSATEIPEDNRYEWVRFPLMMGSGWAFQVLGRGRTVGRSERYEYQCAATKWEEIEVAGKNVRTLRIECQSWVRGSTWRWAHTAWYAPDAKRYIKLTSHYSGGLAFECSAWSVRP